MVEINQLHMEVLSHALDTSVLRPIQPLELRQTAEGDEENFKIRRSKRATVR